MGSKEREEYRSFLANHLTLFAVVILLAGGLYLYFANATTMLVGGVALLLAHIAVVTGIFLLVRGQLGKTLHKLRESSSETRSYEDVQQS